MRHLLGWVLLLFASAMRAAEAPATFAANFEDCTLRIDLYHGGHATEEFYTLDRVVREGPWAGSRVHLLDPIDNGRNFATVQDSASGAVLFSRGFDTYFGEYRTTPAAAKGVRRIYHESIRIPCPKRPVRLVLETRRPDRTTVEVGSFDIDPAAWTVGSFARDAAVTVVESWVGGDPHASVDLVILGEGYTASDEGKFRADLERFSKLLLAAEPYARYRDRFNIRGVFKPSQERGCSEPSHGSTRRTVLGATFDSLGSERYLLTEDNRAVRDLAAHAPYDTVAIMVNSPRYGGGGIYNLFCTFTTDNQWHEYIFLHEFGHSFGGLADEYYTSAVAYNDFYPAGVEPREPNITALLDPNALKWRALLTPRTPVPTPWEKAGYDAMDTAYQKVRQELALRIAARKRQGAPAEEVAALEDEAEKLSREHQQRVDAYLAASAFVGQVGAFEGAGYAAQGLYRPMLDCLMFSKGAKPLCAVCQAAVARVIEHVTE